MAFDWKATVGAIAPAIGTALGGPIVGLATGALCKFFGLSDKATEDQLAAAIRGMTPEQAIQLAAIDAQFKADMAKANVDLERVHAEDRISARNLAAVGGGNFQMVLAIGCIILFFGALGAVFLGYMKGLPPDDKTIINYAIGQISGWVTAAIAFYFGTSKSSQDKDKTINELSRD